VCRIIRSSELSWRLRRNSCTRHLIQMHSRRKNDIRVIKRIRPNSMPPNVSFLLIFIRTVRRRLIINLARFRGGENLSTTTFNMTCRTYNLSVSFPTVRFRSSLSSFKLGRIARIYCYALCPHCVHWFLSFYAIIGRTIILFARRLTA